MEKTATIIPSAYEAEDRVPVPYSFVLENRQLYSRMLKTQQKIKEDSIRRGHTGLAVKMTSMQKLIRNMVRLFEEMTAEGFDILPDKEFAERSPDSPLNTEGKDNDQ